MTDLRALPILERGGYRQSALILGGAQLGGDYGIANTAGDGGDAGAASLLRSAASLGVTHVDTAAAYGESERRVGAAASGLRVVTKIAPGGDVASSVERSVGFLGRPLTILFHRAADALTLWDRLRPYLGETADRIGVSVQSPDELRAVLRLPDLGYVQLPCNILDRRWFGIDIPGDVVVTVRSAYLQGLLAAGSDVRWPLIGAAARDDIVGALDRLALSLGRSRAALCLSYVLGLPWVTSVVVGADTPAQLRDNVALAAAPPLTADEQAYVLDSLPAVPAELLDPSRW